MLKLIYDARPLAQEHTGLGRYTSSLLLGLLDSSSADICQIEVILDNKVRSEPNAHILRIEAAIASRGGVRMHYVPVPAISIRQHWELAKWINNLGGDHYFYPHFDYPLGVKIPSTFVIHDLIPLKVPGYVQKSAWAKKFYFKMMILENVRRADRCIAVSETTRNDIIELVGEKFSNKINVVFEGSLIKPSDDGNVLRLIDQPYLLYVGDRRPHKNIKRVIDLFVELRSNHGYIGSLVLVGNKKNYGFDIEEYVSGRDDVFIAGSVTDDELSWYYEKTDALVFLSEYEGFGLPVIEAAIYNRKIVVSDGGSLAEIAPKGACVIRRDLSVSQAAMIVTEYLASSEDINLSNYVNQFSWGRAARSIFPNAY